jgi:4-oxalocrotonate tautomerase
MPIIQVNMGEGRSAEQKRNLVKAMTEAVVQTLDVAPESVRIMIHELGPDHFAVGGQMKSIKTRADGDGSGESKKINGRETVR